MKNQNQLYDLEIEQELLSILIRDNNHIDKVASVKPYFFYHELHGLIFSAIINLVEKKGFADTSGVNAQLDGNDVYKNNGGRDYLTSIYSMFTMATAENRADMLFLLYTKRRLIDVGQKIVVENSDTPLLSIESNLAKAEEDLYNLSSEKISRSNKELRQLRPIISDITANFDKARKRDKAITGLSTQFTDIDTLLGGFKKSDLIILAARPSMGKSALAINMAYNIAWHNKKYNIAGGVALFCLEMSAEQTITRTVAIHTDKNTRIFETGRYDANEDQGKKVGAIQDCDFEELRKSINELSDIPLYVDDTPAITISQLHTKLRRAKKKYNIQLAVIDYLQLIRNNSNAWQGNRVQEISEITQGLKAIAKELDIPIIALSQLSRAVENREDKKPQLSDLRESGSIEQDADIVMFLYREAYYSERTRPPELPPEPSMRDPAYIDWNKKKNDILVWESNFKQIANLADVMIAKNRNGPIGEVKLYFDRFKTKFSNIVKQNN